MKIITVTVPGALRDETTDALDQYWYGIHKIHLVEPDDYQGYEKVLRQYWSIGEDFMIVEPDIVVRQDVIDAFLTCDCDYGCFPYPWLTDVGPALGCTWFRNRLLLKYPDAMEKVAKASVTWRQLDVVLMRHVLAREYGEQPHVHLPAVQHLNPAKQLLPNANPEPLTSVPHW